MVNRCVAAGCSNVPSDRVSLFRFPKDKALMSKWEKQVQRTRDRWKVTEHSYLCSDHFTEDCFEVDFSSKFGIKKRRQLRPGAIPTIFHRQQPAKDQQKLSLSRKRPSTEKNEDDDGTCSKRKRSVMEKRERHEVTKNFFYKKDCI